VRIYFSLKTGSMREFISLWIFLWEFTSPWVLLFVGVYFSLGSFICGILFLVLFFCEAGFYPFLLRVPLMFRMMSQHVHCALVSFEINAEVFLLLLSFKSCSSVKTKECMIVSLLFFLSVQVYWFIKDMLCKGCFSQN